jgi:hypothetical protein
MAKINKTIPALPPMPGDILRVGFSFCVVAACFVGLVLATATGVDLIGW